MMIKPTRFLVASAALLLALLTLSGCGSSDAIAPAVPAAPGTGNQVVGLSGIGAMPQANRAYLSLAVDGTSTVLNISTPSNLTSTVGTYVGGGAGNKVIVQLDGFDGLKVSDLTSVELDAKLLANTNGTELFYMNFLVDLDCVKDEVAPDLTIGQMRDRRKIVVWQPNSGVVQADGYTRFSATVSTNQWGIVRGATPTFGMANHIDANGPLAIAGYPNACIVDGISADGGLLRDRSMAACSSSVGLALTDSAACGLAHKGALILLGDSGNVVNRSFNVKRVKIKDREIVFR